MNTLLTPEKTQIVATGTVSPSLMAESLIEKAIEKGVTVDGLEKLLNMRRELKAEFAKEQYDIAMAKFQGECPVISKTKEGAKVNGEAAYLYAPIGSIVEQTKDAISRNGFSYSMKTETLDKKVKATCTAKHLAGHSESSTVEVPLGSKTGLMSDTQVVAAALTFAKRYAFCDVFGIITGDEDNDAKKIKDGNAEKTGKLEEMALRISEITSIEDLKDFYDDNKGLGKEFAKMVTEHKKFIESIIKSENEGA